LLNKPRIKNGSIQVKGSVASIDIDRKGKNIPINTFRSKKYVTKYL
jgi:hypothetical protein